MTVHTPTPVTFQLPETAPFTEDQRAWLGGFFAALLVPGTTPTALPPGSVTGIADASAGPALATNDDAPWHDPGMPLPERQKLSGDRPLPQRMMAAMAQQDCGQCGYNCADYANKLFLNEESKPNLCAPGGKETLRAVKALMLEVDAAKSAAPMADAAPLGAPALAMTPAAAGEAANPSRENPAQAIFLSRYRLNSEEAEKQTYHIELDLAGSGLDYEVGDAFGILPRNAPALADAVVTALGARPEGLVGSKTLRNVLIDDVSLGAAPDALFQLIAYVSGGSDRKKAQALAAGDDPDGDAADLDVLGALHKFPRARPHAEALVEVLEQLQPRLYSISSSPKANPGCVALTVDSVRYAIGRRHRLGVASTYLSDRAEAGTPIKAYVQKAHGFRLPEDKSKPVIMVGPGTGVAPFRAFLQERAASKASGPNWLFFGHQRQATDFFYRDEFNAMKKSEVLTRLSLAWSRDGEQKFYVQDRMREVGPDLWRWLADGAHFYVCGDAKRMAKDVETALVDIVATHGARSTDDAIAFVQALKKSNRYQADVY